MKVEGRERKSYVILSKAVAKNPAIHLLAGLYMVFGRAWEL